MEIYYMYTKTGKEFGRHAAFDDEPTEVRPRPGIISPTAHTAMNCAPVDSRC